MSKPTQRSATDLARQIAKLQAERIVHIKLIGELEGTITELRRCVKLLSSRKELDERVANFDAIWHQSPAQPVRITHKHD